MWKSASLTSLILYTVSSYGKQIYWRLNDVSDLSESPQRSETWQMYPMGADVHLYTPIGSVNSVVLLNDFTHNAANINILYTNIYYFIHCQI